MISLERLLPDVLEGTEALAARVVEDRCMGCSGSLTSIFHTMGSSSIEDQTRDLLIVVDTGDVQPHREARRGRNWASARCDG